MRRVGLLQSQDTDKIILDPSRGGWRGFAAAALGRLLQNSSQDLRGMMNAALTGTNMTIDELWEVLDE